MPEMREIIFSKKKEFQKSDIESFIFCPPFFFEGGGGGGRGRGRAVVGRFSQFFFQIFGRWPTMMADIFTQLKLKASNGPALSLVRS